VPSGFSGFTSSYYALHASAVFADLLILFVVVSSVVFALVGYGLLVVCVDIFLRHPIYPYYGEGLEAV